jgi:hypothetical protein
MVQEIVEQKQKTEQVTHTKKKTDGKNKNGAELFRRIGGKEFFYKKDYKANTARVKKIIDAAQNLLYYRSQNAPLPTGADIAYEATRTAKWSDKSEVAAPIISDGTFEQVIYNVAQIGHVEEASMLRKTLQAITDKISAIKLTFNKPNESRATEKDTEKVYSAPLDGKEAYFEENNNAYGVFRKDIDDGRVWFIPKASLSMLK